MLVKSIIGMLLLFVTVNAMGQQMPVYSQYMYNTFVINPAIAGHDGYKSLNITARNQWMNLPQSPCSFNFSGQLRVVKSSFKKRNSNVRKSYMKRSKSGRVGLGINLFNDRRGMYNNMGFQFLYAYHTFINRNQLSLGLAYNLYKFSIDMEQSNVKSFDVLNSSVLIPDLNFGVYLSNRDYYAGFSILEAFQNQLQFNANKELNFRVNRLYYLLGGYKYSVADFVFLDVSTLLKSNLFNGSQLDLTSKFIYKEDYWFGLSYRTGGSMKYDPVLNSQRGAAIVIISGMKFKKYYIGYSYDYYLSSITKYSMGSHEIMLAAKFGDDTRRYRWLNRY